MSWFKRRSADAGKPDGDELPAAHAQATAAPASAAADFDDPETEAEPTSAFEAVLAELATEEVAAEPERDAEDRACLDAIAARGPNIDAACKALFKRHQAGFKRRLQQLGLSDDDQALLINGLFVDLCMAPTKDGQPIRCPNDRVPLAWLRRALLNRTRSWFREQMRCRDRGDKARAQLSPHQFAYRPAGQLAREQGQRDVDPGAREPYSLERRPDDPTFDLAGARLSLLRLRDQLDKLRCSDPQRIKDINLLEAVWRGQLNTREVADYRWQVCRRQCARLCAQADCAVGSEDSGRKALSRARTWLRPLIRHLA